MWKDLGPRVYHYIKRLATSLGLIISLITWSKWRLCRYGKALVRYLVSPLCSHGITFDRLQWYGTPMGTEVCLSPSLGGGRVDLAPLSSFFLLKFLFLFNWLGGSNNILSFYCTTSMVVLHLGCSYDVKGLTLTLPSIEKYLLDAHVSCFHIVSHWHHDLILPTS